MKIYVFRIRKRWFLTRKTAVSARKTAVFNSSITSITYLSHLLSLTNYFTCKNLTAKVIDVIDKFTKKRRGGYEGQKRMELSLKVVSINFHRQKFSNYGLTFCSGKGFYGELNSYVLSQKKKLQNICHRHHSLATYWLSMRYFFRMVTDDSKTMLRPQKKMHFF